MAGALANTIKYPINAVWIFDTLPSDKGVSLGVQPGDLLFETTGNHLWVVDDDHQPVALSA